MKVELVKGKVMPHRPHLWREMSDQYIDKDFPWRYRLDLDLKINGKKFNLYKETKSFQIVDFVLSDKRPTLFAMSLYNYCKDAQVRE